MKVIVSCCSVRPNNAEEVFNSDLNLLVYLRPSSLMFYVLQLLLPN